MGQSNFDAKPYADEANGLLDRALNSAIPYSEGYTKKAITRAEQAQKQSRADSEAGFQRSQALSAPYRAAGYMALDDYMDTLTLSRPEMGSLKLATALESNAKRDAALKQLSLAERAAKDDRQVAAGGNLKGTYIDPETGEEKYAPGIYAEKMANLTESMLRDGWFPSVNTSAGYIPIGEDFTGYLTPQAQRSHGLNSSGGSMWGFSAPPSATEVTQMEADRYRGMLQDYQLDTQYYTPEHGGIASSWNKGLLEPTKWVNVGTSPNSQRGLA